MATKPLTVLVVEPAYSGVALVDEARRLGFRLAVASHDRDDRRLTAAVREQADIVLPVDTNDDDALEAAVLALARSESLAAVVPGFEFYVPAAARIARRLGLPALTAEAARACRDKSVMRRTVDAAGLRVPRYASATDQASLEVAARRVGFPCVLKPTTSAGSIHVTRTESWKELLSAYRRILADERLDFGRRLDGTVLVEEYVGGREFSVEGVVVEGEVNVLAITSKILGPEPHFVEVGHIVQADLPRATRLRLERYAAAVVRALGVSIGPFHCEVRLDGEDPVLMELGARLPGDHIVDLVEMTTGSSLPRLMLGTYAGLDLDVVETRRPATARYAGIRFFTAPELAGCRWAERLHESRWPPWVTDVEVAVVPNSPTPPGEDFRCRVAHVLFVADDYATAEQRWHAVREADRFVA